jgi:hypothetical protein
LIFIVSLLLVQTIAVAVPVLAASNSWTAHTLIHIARALNYFSNGSFSNADSSSV